MTAVDTLMAARVPPHNLDAEASLLGALLLSRDALTAVPETGISASDFYKPAHQHVYEAIRVLTSVGDPVDAVTVADELRRNGLLEEMGGPTTLLDLQAATPAISNAARYARIVQETAMRRRLIALASDAVDVAYDEARDPSDALRSVSEALEGLSRGAATRSDLPSAIDWTKLLTGDGADEEWLVDGLWPARRAISVAARYKAGKSLLLFYVSACLARGVDPWTQRRRAPVNVAYFDLEMTEDDVRERTLDFGFEPADLGHFRYYLLPSLPPLDTPAGGRAVLEIVRRDGAEAAVFDTLGRFVEGEENSADTFAAFDRYTGKALKAERIASARADHVGHGNQDRARGSSGKGSDVDVAWILTRGDDRTTALNHHGVSRLRWVPPRLDLVLLDAPERFARTDQAWPAGTHGCAALLDELGVPLKAGERAAGAALREAGHKVSNEVLRPAISYRREAHPEHPQ